MWNYKRKTTRDSHSQTKTQKQAWIENWTIWALLGMIGFLNNILGQAKSNRVRPSSRLKLLIWDMTNVIKEIKEEQQDRKKL